RCCFSPALFEASPSYSQLRCASRLNDQLAALAGADKMSAHLVYRVCPTGPAAGPGGFEKELRMNTIGEDSSSGSVSGWLDRLKAGDQAAAQPLWERYFLRLTALARHKLQGAPRRLA